MQSILEKKKAVTQENPFYKMGNLLNMMSQLPKASDSISKQEVWKYLSAAWNECTDKIKKEAFFVILFSIGDIQNREHNIFRKVGIKDVDGGGNSKRRVFALSLEWLLTNNPEQFYRFMPIYGEYYNLDVFRLYHLVTDRKTGSLKEIMKLPVSIERVTSFIADTLRSTSTTDNEKGLWARWLPHVPSIKRTRKYLITDKNINAFTKGGHSVKVGDIVTVKKDKKEHTSTKDSWVTQFIFQLSKKMNWQVVGHASNFEYRGYRTFRKKYLETSEAAMFSSHRIKQLDESQLFEWFNKLPNGARFRVACRLVYKDSSGNYVSKGKWINKFGVDIASVYVKWLNSKEKAQQIVRNLTAEEKEQMAPAELRMFEKAAKVNTGAEGLLDVIADVLGASSQQEADVRIQSIMDKIQIEVPVRILADISGSMTSRSVTHKGKQFTAADMCRLATTLFLLKNPDEELSDLFIRFNDKCEVVCSGQSLLARGENKFMGNKQVTVEKLIDKTKPFSWNYANVSQYLISGGYTYLTSVSEGLRSWVRSGGDQFTSQRIEMINKYPVWLVLSDGDINNSNNPAASIQQFQNDMRQYFGWEGILLLWDICEESQLAKQKYDGLNNFIHLAGCNPSTVNQVFKNIHDLDIVDTYLPLKAIHASNRYAPVKALVS